ncbi:hypothetical protein RND81_04G088400 [Saponaria officinalis]|uniref:Pectinesterase inhibitor domain-containing protein n=1 Tax=Saponaria officinalis TaxID=3572 RepID=A0AAW1LIS8_SAPOF
MKGILLATIFITLSFALAVAEQEKPKAESINIDEVCKNTTSKDVCVSTLKSLGADQDQQKLSKFAQKVIRHAQSEFGHTSTKAREKMREDDLDMKIKKALSHCVKMYLDIADELRGLYLSAKSKKFSSEGTDFMQMAQAFPRHCEHGLTKVGTSGEKLNLYKNYKDLEDLASIVDAVILYANNAKKDIKGKQ